MAIKTVAVLGASGNLGKEVVKALLAEGFAVTAVKRVGSSATFPDGVQVREADVASVESLTGAFEGHDAVVSTIGTGAAAQSQEKIVDAVVAAGVKRYLPSEFGFNIHRLSPKALDAMLGGKQAAEKYLLQQVEATSGRLTYTGVATGLFLDLGFDIGLLGVSLPNKTITIYDSGNERAAFSTMSFVGLIVASVLKHEEETANKYIEAVQFVISQNEIHDAIVSSGAKLNVVHAKTADAEAIGNEKLARQDYSSFVDFSYVYNYTDGAANAVKPEDNIAYTTLGLPKQDLAPVIAEILKSKGY